MSDYYYIFEQDVDYPAYWDTILRILPICRILSRRCHYWNVIGRGLCWDRYPYYRPVLLG